MYKPVLAAHPCPGDEDWQLLDVNPEVFQGGSGPGSSGRYPDEARGQLKARNRAGYITDEAVLAAYRRVSGLACWGGASCCCNGMDMRFWSVI
jgi:hypothetical protein